MIVDIFDVEHAYNLVKRFYDEASERNARMFLEGNTPDHTETLMPLAQLSVLGWLLHETDENGMYENAFADDANRFNETLKRLESHFGDKEDAAKTA